MNLKRVGVVAKPPRDRSQIAGAMYEPGSCALETGG
jgi:hypothetical protein